MYARNLQDPRFQQYIDEIESLRPLNADQEDILLNGTGEDDHELTEEDVIPMCEMIKVNVDLSRSNILYTAERDWPEMLAEKIGKQYDDMSEKEKTDLNEEIRRVVTEKGEEIYDQKVDMVKHHQKLDAYNSRAIAFYLEDRRYKRLIAALKAATDQNNSPSTSQAVDMDQHDTLDDVMDNNDNGDDMEYSDTEDGSQHGDDSDDDENDATDKDETHSQQISLSNLVSDSDEMHPGFDL